jgi:hypothetical protein
MAASLQAWIKRQLADYPLLSALQQRRSRRFGPGMEIPEGPFAYRSQVTPQPLTEADEAAMIFAGAGITGYAIADLSFGTGQGGSMLSGLAARTIASPDSIDAVSMIVINDEATYFIKRPQNLTDSERDELVTLAQAGDLLGIYQRLRVRIADGRVQIPVVPGVNFNINKWSLYAQGSTYFLPVNDITSVYINALLEAFEPEMGLFVVDERNLFLPAGIARFAKSRGGHLWDNLKEGRVVTVQGLEMSFAEAASVEQGMMLQNLMLMGQTLGLGGFANYARHEYRWFQALGFEMQSMSSTRYAGVGWLLSQLVRLIGQEFPYPYATSLQHQGQQLLTAWCPPNFPTMEAAVRAYVDYKFGKGGVWREGTAGTYWKDATNASKQIKAPSEQAIQATIAYCTYLLNRYGRFPAYSAPFRTVIGYQASHVDCDFYDRFYHPAALSHTQRERFEMMQQSGA